MLGFKTIKGEVMKALDRKLTMVQKQHDDNIKRIDLEAEAKKAESFKSSVDGIVSRLFN